MKSSKTILVAALNWGIGHATRDIPIINRLIQRGCKVILASDGSALNVWKRTFPNLTHIELPSWNIKYQKKGSFMLMMASRTPYILKAIQQERKRVRELVKEYQIDGIISDNRFGVIDSSVPNVFITHQVSLKLSKQLQFAEPVMNLFNHFHIKKFDTVWVPDYETQPNLTGDLSHKHFPNKQTKFIGPISRFIDIWDGKFPEPEHDIAIVLSGVEPQRTMLEEKLIEQLKPMTDLNVILVQGKSSLNNNYEIRDGFRLQSFMDSEELVNTFLKSKYIVCRSGYSTILDLAVLKQTALMIPTPGQTEQEYLGEWMHNENLIVCQNQNEIDIPKAIEQLKQTKGFNFEITDIALNKAIDEFLDKI